MERVVVVTDSSTCLPTKLAAEFGIRVLQISEPGPDYPETADEASEELRWRLPEAVEHAELSRAHHPFVTEYLAAIEESGFDAAVIVTPAIEFAAMLRNAELATALAQRPAVTIDARTAAAGQALVVLAGAEAAAKGADLGTVVQVIEDASNRVDLVASLATLEPMRDNVPGSHDLLRPLEPSGARSLFRMRGGTVEPVGTASDLDAALETIHDLYARGSDQGIERRTVFHADLPNGARRLSELLGGVDFVSGFSVAMQVHTGRGVVGAAWLPRA